MQREEKLSIPPGENGSDWKQELRRTIRSMDQLLATRPELSEYPDLKESFKRTQSIYRFSTTPYYLNLANFENQNDPILKQILPDWRETTDPLFEDEDPLREETHSIMPGVIHRYPDRILILLNTVCPVYCRFCTRKRKVLGNGSPEHFSLSLIPELLGYLEIHPEITEVILSGGEPLLLSDSGWQLVLNAIRGRFSAMGIRIHSRIPVVLPSRITDALVAVFKNHFPLTLVTHFNHPAEITPESSAAILKLRMAGVTVLNQSVLLKNINDTLEIQQNLLRGLNGIGIHPYYLHQCDEVKSVSHFRCDPETGLSILKELRGRNPGHLIPRYMIDLPGGGGKIPLENNYRLETDPEHPQSIRYRNYRGDIYETKITDPTEKHS